MLVSTANIPAENASQPRSPLSPSTSASEQSPYPSTQDAPISRDLTSLLDPQNYFDIPQDDIPDAFRVEPPSIPSDEDLLVSLKRLDTFLQSKDYLSAASLTGLILWGGHVSPTDHNLVFYLISTRFACLSFYQSIAHIAAQESRILFGDINNEFWHIAVSASASEDPAFDLERPSWSTHIIPYEFRLQITILQTLTFSEGGRPDGRRGLTALYELGLECRERALFPSTNSEDLLLWQNRLQELNVLVLNTLIEMEELETARRTLQNTLAQLNDNSLSLQTKVRLALILLRLGDITAAHRLLSTPPSGSPILSLLQPLISVADGNYASAVSEFEDILKRGPSSELVGVIKQNLAVCLLYSGQVDETKSTLQGLVDDGYHFRSLTFNLATLYELTSDRSQALKLELVDRMSQRGVGGESRGESNADFKL